MDEYTDYGGDIIVVEFIKDFKETQKKMHININSMIVEYIDNISCVYGETYT